jgi:hypothetical protein
VPANRQSASTAPARTIPVRTGPAAWHVITGTARGRSHEVRGMPSEDAVAHRHIAATGGTVVAVADGHGHERHFRSATGSAIAVRVACQVADALATEITAELGADFPPGHTTGAPGRWIAPHAELLRDNLPPAIVQGWRAEIARHVEDHPYAAEERAVLERDGDGPDVPYGSTLLVAVVTGGWLVCAQIGDGDMVAVTPDGMHSGPVPGDSSLDGLRTTSLCQPDALRAFRVGVRDLAMTPLAAVLLATDGYGNAQAADHWQPAVARDLAGMAAEKDPGWFARQVPGWAEMCASGQGSGDDTTIALLLAPAGPDPAASGTPGQAGPAGAGNGGEGGGSNSTWTR